jgi:hypothetical protein
MDKYAQTLIIAFKNTCETADMAGYHIQKQYQMTKIPFFLFAMIFSYLYNPHSSLPVTGPQTGRLNQNPGAAQFNNILSTIPPS